MTPTFEIRLPNDTKKLDGLLDERGQEHSVWPSGMVVWNDDCAVYEYEPAENHHDEYWGGILRMTRRHITPEQAIAATVGAGTCKNIGHDTFVCSECGAHVHITNVGRSYLDENGKRWYSTSNEHKFRHCPNCGKQIVEEEAE